MNNDSAPSTSSPPLRGIRVLDMTRVVAGPYAGQILGDLGADVVKIERPGEGDDCRRVGPPWIRPNGTAEIVGESTYYQAVNRNKRCITVDFAKPEGAALVRDLASRADVLLENYRSGTLKRYGLGYDTLSGVNPRLIYCSITGFGQTGPYANRSGYDYLVQAMAGLMSVTGHRDTEPGAGPMRVGVPIADICAGLYATIAVQAALMERTTSAQGQYIDVSLFDAQLSAMLNTFSGWFNAGTALGRTGNDHPSAAPYGVYQVDDGFILIATFNDREFARLAVALGHAEWATDPAYQTMGARVGNRARLKEMVTDALKGRTRAYWIETLNAATVSCGPINEMRDVEHDPHVQARGSVVTQYHPVNGVVRSAASPMRFSRTPTQLRHPPPRTGEHTDAILAEWLGRDAASAQQLRRDGIV